jgi:mannose-6-phosphate isomerase-like protein (cupin superfamily)
MADVLTLPGDVTFEVTRSTAETGGELVELLFTLPPGGRGPPAHVHEHVEEWEVVAGRLEARIDGDRRTLDAGESLTIPAGTAHTFRNSSSEPVRVRDRHRPAGRFEEFVRAEVAVVADGLHSPAALLRMAILWDEYRDTQVPASRLGRGLVAAGARLGRTLGLSKRP